MNHTFPISNGILRDGHPERIGAAIWEFMWCIDRSTKVDDNGRGVVLGGKPIKMEEFKLGHRNSVALNLSKLCSLGYIQMTRTPQGYVIKVNRIIKWFKRSTRNSASLPSDAHKTGRRCTETSASNKTVKGTVKDIDNKKKKKMIPKKTKKFEGNISASMRNDVYKVIDAFDAVNRHAHTLHESAKQYDASMRMIQIHGIEIVLKVVAVLPKTNEVEFFPRIYTPAQLEEKWESLHHAWTDAVKKKIKKTPKVLFS